MGSATVAVTGAFARYLLAWIDRWLKDGFAPVRTGWTSHAKVSGAEIELVSARERERCLEHAAKLVQNFADDSAPGALDALLSLGENDARQDAQRALRMARSVTKQTKVLHTEVDRFLSVKRR